MILSISDILRSLADGQIAFEPEIEEEQYGEASIDLRLGYQFTKIRESSGLTFSIAEGLGALQSTELWNTADLMGPSELGEPQFIEIKPRDFLLATTLERISVPRNMIARIEGRSSYARLGLSMHQTAPWIQPGWSGRITLELMNNGPLTIKLTPVKDRPCQITFFRLTSEVPKEYAYGAKAQDAFQDQDHPLRVKTSGRQ